jgi:hypothetical protein
MQECKGIYCEWKVYGVTESKGKYCGGQGQAALEQVQGQS